MPCGMMEHSVLRSPPFSLPDRGGGRSRSHPHDPAPPVLCRAHGRQPGPGRLAASASMRRASSCRGRCSAVWSDTTGRKPLLIVSQLGTCVGFIVTAFAPNLWVLFLARAIDGMTAGNLSLAQAYISDVTQARGPGARLRPHRHRVRPGFPGRPRRLRRAGRLRLPAADLCRGRVVRPERPHHVAAAAGGEAGRRRWPGGRAPADALRMARLRGVLQGAAVWRRSCGSSCCSRSASRCS